MALVLGFCATSCGKKKSVDPEFQPYLDSFYAEATARGVNVKKDISMQFGETIPGATAQCVLDDARPSMGGNEIIVNQAAWIGFGDSYYAIEKEVILYHELGHCLLGLETMQRLGTLLLCAGAQGLA